MDNVHILFSKSKTFVIKKFCCKLLTYFSFKHLKMTSHVKKFPQTIFISNLHRKKHKISVQVHQSDTGSHRIL